MISDNDIEYMIDIAKTDPGMADLLARAEEYYLLKRDTNSGVFSSMKLTRAFDEYFVQHKVTMQEMQGNKNCDI